MVPAAFFCEKDTVRTRIAGADTLIGPSPPHGSLLEDPRDCHGSRARKERAPGIPRGMMRGKAHKPRQLPQRGSQAAAAGLRADEGIGPYK